LPADVKVTLLADRGFADQKFFRFLEEELQFTYVIRIKSSTTILHEENRKKAAQWQREDGKIVYLQEAFLTLAKYPIQQFVAVKDTRMKAAWFLVSNSEYTARKVIQMYSKRWKIEPYFRDLKNGRYGLGLESTHIKSCERRDRLMLILAIAYTLLTLLGEAGEKIGFDKKLKVNTVKTRTHSLFRQGQFYYKFFFHFSPEEQHLLMHTFQQVLMKHDFWGLLFEDVK
jgi:transposase